MSAEQAATRAPHGLVSSVPTDGPPTSGATFPQPSANGYVVTFAAVAVVIIALTAWLIERERGNALAYWQMRQRGATDVMAVRVSDWLSARRADAQVLAAAPAVSATLSGQIDVPTAFRTWVRERFAAYLALVAATHRDRGVYVLNPEGQIVARSPDARVLEAAAISAARTAARDGKIRVDVYGSIPELSLASFTAPVGVASEGATGAGSAAGSVMIVTSLAETLFPLLSGESVPSDTGETLLVRREGGDTVYTNPLRHRPAHSPQLRIAFTTTPLPSRLALIGETGVREAIDYRGVAVLAAFRSLPETGWGLVHKIDRDEAMADFRRLAVLEGGVAGLLVVALAIVLIGDWQRQRTRLLSLQVVAARAVSRYTRSLIEASLDPLVTISPEGRITDVNTATEQATGIARTGLIGTDFCDYFSEPEQARAGYRAVFSRGSVRDYPLTLRHAGGSTIDVLYNASVYRSEAGEVEGAFAAARDVTERKRVEIALRRTAADLERSNDELEQFAYVASHDLQEPLRMVASYVELLARRYKGRFDADADEFIAYAVDGATRMQRLINDLLSYSRVGTVGCACARVDAEQALRDVLADLRETIASANAVVSHDALPSVAADAVQLRQVLQNLIVNAIKFRGVEPPRIHVSAQRQDGSWRFSVRDNGIGVAPEHRERIFIIFQRLHARDAYPGTGIGLAVCKRIVERRGGLIWVESQPAMGSTFFFTIPDAGGQ